LSQSHERFNNANQYPVAAKAGLGNKQTTNDMVTAKLAALQFYQLAIAAPKPLTGSFDQQTAARRETLFKGKATCSQCPCAAALY
jgi:hypothetical protein